MGDIEEGAVDCGADTDVDAADVEGADTDAVVSVLVDGTAGATGVARGALAGLAFLCGGDRPFIGFSFDLRGSLVNAGLAGGAWTGGGGTGCC